MIDTITTGEEEFIRKLMDFSKSLIIKDQVRADLNETAEIARNANEYVLAYSERDTFFTYKAYTRQEMYNVGIRDEEDFKNGLTNPNLIPNKYHDYLLIQRRKTIINNYEELNNYYRMLNGLPDYGDEPIKVSSGKFITELTPKELLIVERNELDELIRKNPTNEYLKHLGDRRVSFYDSRTAKPFYILNYEKYIFEEERAKKFIELYYKSLVYTNSILYNDAFKNQTYYNSFMSMFMVFDTMQKFIAEQFNYAIRKDFYDLDSIRDTFLSYGLPFFEEIPLKYQKRIVKNINKLLKYKGTNKVLIDVVNLFGFTNTELFKYYLIKDFKRKDGDKLDIDFEDFSNSYELKFAQVPLDDTDVSSALRQKHLYQSYEEVVADDPFWGETDGENDLAQDEFKQKLLETEFNYINTKYMSMNTMFNLAQANFEACYFFNLINTMEDKALLSEMEFTSNQIKHSGNFIRVFDAVTAIFYLLFKRFGYDDNIIYSPTAVASIYGFNFDGDIEELIEKVKKASTIKVNDVEQKFDMSKLTPEELKVLSITDREAQKSEMIDLFFYSREYSTRLKERINKTDDYAEYKALKAIYDYNMYSNSIKDLYENGEQDNFQTYSEYLEERDLELYEYVELNSRDKESVIKAIDTILLSLEAYFNSEKFEYIFSSLTNISGELVKTYMMKMLNIFKAYTVELNRINIYYVFDDRFVSSLKMFSYLRREINNMVVDSLMPTSGDDFTMKSYSSLNEKLEELKDYAGRTAKMTLNDREHFEDLLNIFLVDISKADSLLYDLVDYIKRVFTIHKKDFEKLSESHEFTPYSFKEEIMTMERITDVNQQLGLQMKQTVSQLVKITSQAKRVSILKQVDKDLQMKHDVNILLIKQIIRLGMEFDESLTKKLSLMDADELFTKNDFVIREKTINKTDSKIEFEESFLIQTL